MGKVKRESSLWFVVGGLWLAVQELELNLRRWLHGSNLKFEVIDQGYYNVILSLSKDEEGWVN
jgi:hypothetical protein